MLAQDVKKGTFEFFTIRVSPFKIKKVTGIFLKKSYFSDMIVLNNYAYLAVTVRKKKIIQVLNIRNGSIQNYFPETELREKSLGFESMRLTGNKKNKEILMTYFACSKKKCEYYVYRFNYGAKKIGLPISVKSEDEKAFTSLTLSKVTNGYVMSGTYSDEATGSSQGMYFGKMNNNGSIKSVQHYNFLEFTNFLNYLSEKKQAKIKKKKNKKEQKGKELKIDYNVTIHDVIQKGDEYLLVAEFYYSTYRTVRSTSYVNGERVTTSYQVFDGYQYSHAVIAGFVQTGKMLWNNSFEMWVDRKPMYVKQFITTSINQDNITLMFATGSSIKAATYKNGKEVISRVVDYIDIKDDEKVSYTYDSNISYWYDNNYISWGYQRIITPKKGRDDKEYVHYINKIIFGKGNSKRKETPKRAMNNSDF